VTFIEAIMRFWLRAFVAALISLCGVAAPAQAQGTLPLALQQQFAFTACTTTSTVCGTPLLGGLLYFYAVGTVATPQDSFQDSGLTIKNPWPLPLDSSARVPMFYLASGSVHVRLTDANGVVQYDNSSMLVIGPSGGGGGGSSVDATTVLSTGDIKFRATSETLAGWVPLNAGTIGNATSGANLRANADTQSLFVYLWTNCPDAHCPVGSGRGASALADFNANKAIQVPDWRGRGPIGRDCMGNGCANRISVANVSSGGGDGADTANATGGTNATFIAQNQLPNVAPTTTLTYDAGGLNLTNSITPVMAQVLLKWNTTPTGNTGGAVVNSPLSTSSGANSIDITPTGANKTLTAATSSINGNVTQQPLLTMSPFMLGTWYVKL
jgi:hypothetical protein